jgi:hypothetical protein
MRRRLNARETGASAASPVPLRRVGVANSFTKALHPEAVHWTVPADAGG